MASAFSAQLVIFFLCSMKISSPQLQVPLDCLPGWAMKENQCYKLFSNPVPWISARRMCASYGGYLAMPFDYYTNEDIGEYVHFQGVNEYWLGASRIGVSPSDNVTLFYNGKLETRLWVGYWSVFQPKSTDEDCVFVTKYKRQHHKWSFSPCERTIPFLCQRPSCFPGSFHCVNGRCISAKGMCDGYNDCGDRSDETDCPQLCSWYIRTSTQGIVNYPDTGLNYSNNAVCLWLIETDVGTHVQLTVTFLSLENNSDEMIIMDSGLTESSSVEIVHLTGHSTIPETYYSSDNKMLLKFTSDGSVTNTGFSVTYSQVNPSGSSKNLNATNTWQDFEFPYYNSSLLGSQDLDYVVETEDQTKTVTFQVLDIDLPADATVIIRDGNTVYSSILAILYGTYKGSGTFLSSGRYLYIALHTVRGSKSRGLKVRYIQGCQSSLDQSTGYISSPGYPVSLYPNGVTCNWVVNVSGVQNVTIIFSSLDLHVSDRIQIMVENSTIGDYSGNSTQTPLRITGGQFSVVFTSSGTVNHRGFNLTYSVDCPEPTIDLDLSNIVGRVSTFYGSEFTITCKQGSQFFQSEHIGKANVTMICMAFGLWNVNTSPKCERIQCQKVASVQNGYVARSIGNLPYNGTLTYKCYQGYMLVGTDTVTCDVNGRWVNLPSCQASSCGPAPPADLNGNVYIAAVNASLYGTVLRYSCNQGYDLIGDPTLFCDSNGSYVGKAGTCKILTCYINGILNGIVSSNKVQVGEQIMLTCNTGYRSTTGETSMLCNSNRTLTPTLSCQNINECEDKSRCQHRCIDTEGSYYCTCNQGYEVTGNFCTDIDECKTMNPCSHNYCTNIEGSYQCSCPAGYSLFVANGTQGHLIPATEDGIHVGDVYRLNHTCVRNVCSSPPAIIHMFVLSQKTTYYYEDTVMYKCQLGYILENPMANTLRCSQSGNWTGIEIKCTRAVCVLEPVPTNLVNPGIVSTSNTSILFGEFLTITCNVPGFTPQTFLRKRQCTLIGSSYRLDGSINDYECGFISCGKPYDEPGSNYEGLSTYYYRNSFTFTCQPTFKLTGNSFKTGNTTVTCQNSGQWDFGNLTCTGAQCMDPGQPYLGSQALSDYREGQLVVFSCSEPGYTLRPPNPISCGLLQNGTAKFNGSLPACIDTQVPNITNCPQKEIVVARQMSVGAAVPQLQIQDNGGIKNVAVEPAWPPSQYYVTSVQIPVRFTYTVTDYGDNQAVCTISFRRRDETAPTIVCPPTTLTYTFRTENDTRFIRVDRGWVTVNDDGTLASQLNVTFSVENYTFDPKSLFLVTIPPTQYKTILATVVDAAGNSASCSFGLFFQPDACSPYSLRTPANSNKNCVAVGLGYNCTITCNQGYRLFNNILSNSVSTYCSAPGVVFASLVDVKCVNSTSHDGSYKLEFDFVYDMHNISRSCIDSYENIIRNTLQNLTLGKSIITDTFCQTGAVFVQGQIGLGYITVMETEKVLVHYAVSFDRRPGDNYSKCAAGVKLIMSDPHSYQLNLVEFKSMACEPITLTKNISLTFEGYYCEDPTRMFISPNGLQNLSYCLPCPEGTFFNSGMCTLCPRGTFGELSNVNMCQPCPQNTSTYSSGAVYRSECASVCDPGFFSTNGLPPCDLCPKNTFSVNSTTCLSCPPSDVTRVAGAKSQMDCKASCLPGTFNEIDGHENCTPCPVHHYSNQTAALKCTECAKDEYTNSTGKISISDCLKLNQTQCLCQNGYCVSRLPHITSCICYDGWTGEYCNKPFDSCASHPCYNGGTCASNGSSYICSCPTGTLGTKCEVITKTCTLDYCQNNGMCENLVNKPVCHCLAGFTGDRCQTTQNICASGPCKNGGTCTAIGGKRFSCLCPSGFNGRTCEENNDDCYERPCRNNGTCRDGYNAFACDCGTVYTGRYCETRNLLCSSYDCGPGSRCLEDETNNSIICICNEYTELNSSLSTCKAKDLCATNPCLNNGSCVSTSQSFNCLCPFGYGGSLCQLNNNDCLSIPCENGGQCQDLVGAFYCNCSGTGFQGERCNLPINDCASQPCNATGTAGCEDMVNGYHCRCKIGYTGNNCEGEINECDSDPCLHNASCKDMVNGYMCQCPIGWTSTNCETEIKLCTNTTCLNGAMCVDYFNGYFCRCEPNTYGENCSARVNVCQITNPCIHGSCQDSNGSFQCTCDDGYEGDQCGIQLNFCNTNMSTCKNDGQCIPQLDSYECKCPEAYTGKDCSVAVDNCLSTLCPFGSTCLNVDGKAYCRCPLDKEGQNCDKEWDQDFDLLFDHEHNIGMAYLPYPIKLNNSAFSISLWLQFGKKDAKGTVLSLMTVPEPSSLRGRRLLLWIDEKTIYYNSNGTVVNLTHDIDYRSDGQWHYLVANVNLMAGVLNFFVDTVNSAPLFFPANGMNAKSVWLLLGSMYDPVTNMPQRDKGFYGKLSKVTLYSRELQHRDEITILGNTNVSSLFMNSIIRWSSEFKYSNGVIRKAPSEADRSCPFGFTNYSTCDQLLPGKRTVEIISGQCPNDVLQYSPNRLAQVFWSTPTFSGQDSLTSSFISGDTFVWGKYSVVIQASNSDGNAAQCLFNIFVQNDNCKSPKTPPEADELRCSAPYEKYKQCELICKNNTAPSIPSPRLYTCGPVGNWDPDNKFLPYRITPCGAISQPVRQIIIALRYSVPTLECTAFKETLDREVLKTQTNLNHEWNYVCTQANCSDTDIKVTCLNTRLNTSHLDVEVILTLMDIPESVTSRLDGTIKRTEDLYRDLLLAVPPANSFNYSNFVSDAVPILTSLRVLPLCKAPKVFQENQCVDCGRGTFYNETERECQFCPLNSYQPYQGQNSCVPCPPGTTTATRGSCIASECYDECLPGQFMNLTNTPPMCTNCSRGLYQPERGRFSCLFCPANKTTKYTGAILDSDCANDCPPGQEISSNNSCTDCRIGFYRSPYDAICQRCPNGTVTQNTSQISESACSVADNPPGTKRRQDNPLLYDLCPRGTYQSERWQSDCMPCAAHYLTEKTGSTDVTDCKFSCPAGLEKKPNDDSCVQCGVGYFRDGVKPFDQCKACPGQFTTMTAGSTSQQNCTLYRCSVGEQPNYSNNGCEPCPTGTYQDLQDKSRCTPCSAGKSTRRPGATKPDLCESYCSSGAENIGSTCQECSIGYFKDNNENVFGNCTRCKDSRYVTPAIGSVSNANCTVLNCMEGYKANLTLQTCVPCPRGTYQNKKYQPDCTPCPENLYTRYKNSTRPQDCETYCDSGYQKNATNCTACQRGYYKDNTVDLFMVCTSCGGKYVTPVGPPATNASQCIIRNCQPGSYIDGDNCTLCPKGSFQDQPWQTNCTQCAANRNTETDGATNIAMCLLSCPAGSENNGMSNACDPCMIGYYKETEAAARCRPCGNFSENDIRITNTNGSTSITNCTKLVCLAGYYPASEKCTPCDYGTYQTTKWTDSCNSCPMSHTTYKRGAVTEMDCEYNCSLGEELVNGTCIKCAVGFYNDKSDPSRRQCFQCRGNQITLQEGATSAAQCSIVDCSNLGQYRDVNDNTCKDCPIGTFQDTIRQTTCKLCPSGFKTQSVKSTSVVDCKKDCEAGYSLDIITNTCMACPAGSYRNKTDGNWNCVSCGANLTTLKSASDKLSDCSVPTCSPGYAYNTSEQVCTICPVNSYTSRVGEFLPCRSCPNDKITDSEGSSSPEECHDPCSTDYQLHNGQCTYKCDIPNYCGSKGECIRSPFKCRCREGYSGLLCDIRPDASALSDQETETIIIAVVTTVTGLLFIILLIVCICVIIRKRSSVKRSHSFEIDEHTSNTTRSMKGSDDYPAFAVNPAFSSKPPSIFASPNGALASQGIQMYSNPTYNGDEDNDPAVYRA